jgi:hypothetical protein
MDIECKLTPSFHPLQGTEKWLRDPFATFGISLNVSSCLYHYPQLKSLCLIHILITEAIASICSFVINKIPSFWPLVIVQTRFKNASCRQKESLFVDTRLQLASQRPCVYRTRLHDIVPQCEVNLSWPFAEAFAHFLLFPKNFNARTFWSNQQKYSHVGCPQAVNRTVVTSRREESHNLIALPNFLILSAFKLVILLCLRISFWA